MAFEQAGAEQLDDEPGHHFFGQRGHIVVVRVRLVPLRHREFRIVEARKPLVPKIVADLVHLLESAHETALEVQLIGDAEVERRVEGLVMCLERQRRRATVQGL